jgi:hypothetical protein
MPIKLTPLLLTHYSPKAEYGDAAPPSSELVVRTLDSLYHRVRQNDFGGLQRPILVYNEPYKLTSEANAYKENLKDVCKSRHVKLHVQKNDGIRSGLTKLIELMNTQYGFFLEHDWEIVRPIDFKYIVETLHNHDEVNYIRLNKRQNTRYKDPYLDSCNNYPYLCKSGKFSNNPHFFDVKNYSTWIENSKFNYEIMKILLKRSHRNNMVNIGAIKNAILNKYIFGPRPNDIHTTVEDALDLKYRYDIKNCGFEFAHADWGIYLYGQMGDGPYIQHLGR